MIEEFWSKGAPMPTPRTEVTAVSIGYIAYVIGGFNSDGNPTDIVEAYDTRNNSWMTNVTSLPMPLHHAAAAVSDQGKIYVAGGYFGEWEASDKLFIYDPMGNDWTEGNPMLTPRGSPNTNFVNGTLYVIGGDNNDPVNTNESYDPKNNQWVSKSPMPTSRHHAASAAVNDSIYVIGGRITGSLDNVDIVEKYNTSTDKWTSDLEPMPTKRSGIASSSIGDFIYVFGGEQNNGTFNNNERYDATKDSWTHQYPMPTARHGLGVTAYDGQIFVIGGGPSPGLTVTDANEIFHVASNKTSIYDASG
jgi:N-acetylneuraminic acid mutarotase